MRFLIDFIFIIFSFFYSLSAIFNKKKNLSSLKIRFSPLSEELKKELEGKNPIWLHAVSVGEAISASYLIELLCKKYPKEKLIVSTVTSTGNEVAKKILPKNVSVVYLPLDLSFIVRKTFSSVKPKLFILTEAEIWPNLILELKKRKVPITLINGRISKNSFRGYLIASFLFRKIFSSIDLFCMKSVDDATRAIKLGAPRAKVKITGSTKFDLALSYKVEEAQEDKLKKMLGISSQEMVLVSGSTHHPEEKILVKVFLNISKKHPDLKLIVAPRHPERVGKIKKTYQALGLKYQLFSSLSETNPAEAKVILVDKMGILRDLYKIAGFAFVGGSLARIGGHNILEPAGLGKAVIFGKWVRNFRQEAELLTKAGAGVMVKDEKNLEEVIGKLLEDKQKLKEMGEAARAALERNSGAISKNLELLEKLF